MTSLAAQLKKLAVPETQSVLTRDLKQDSFLYDEGEAATFDKQHFYNIGVNGLLQLMEKDSRFSEYERTLFSPSSQSLQRYVQTSEVNNVLDASISTFLLQLSPYMQLREAHKALEWMVHRYNVHLRNVNAFMMCLLPYHDQAPFVRGLRLLKLDSNEAVSWRWLEPVKKGGMFLPKATLTTHCRSAKGFLGFLCDMLKKHIEANTDSMGSPLPRRLQRVITFYTQCVLGVLAAGPPDETHISVLIPAVSAGLRSQELPDYAASSYMVLGQLFSQASLSQTVLDSLLNVIAKNIRAELLDPALTVVVIMFQTQTINKVSKKAYKYLSRQGSLVPALTRLSCQTKVDSFLIPFVTTAIQRLLKSTMDVSSASDSNAEDIGETVVQSPLSLILNILGSVTVSNHTVQAVTKALMIWCVDHLETLKADVQSENMPAEPIFKIFRHLEHRFSDALETSLGRLCNEDTSGKTKTAMEILFELSVGTAQEDLDSDPLASLTLCLHHRDSGVRKKAVNKLMSEPHLISEASDIQGTLSLRLQDEDPEVVKAVLTKSEALWAACEDKALLKQNLLRKHKSAFCLADSPMELKELLLQALLSMPGDTCDITTLYSLSLSALLITGPQEAMLAKTVFTTHFGTSNPLMKRLAKEWLPTLEKQKQKDLNSLSTQSQLLVSLAEIVTSYLQTLQSTERIDFLRNLQETVSNSHQPARILCMALLVTQSLIGKVEDSRTKGQLQQLLVVMIVNATHKQNLVKIKDSRAAEGRSPTRKETTSLLVLSDSLACLADSGRLTMNLMLYLLTCIHWQPLLNSLKEKSFWLKSACNDYEWIWMDAITKAFTFLLKVTGNKRWQGHILADQVFSQLHTTLINSEYMLQFLCAVWLNDEVRGEDRAHAINFAQVYISALPQSARVKVTAQAAPALPSLLLLLFKPQEKVREAAFVLLSDLYKDLSPETLNAKWFVNHLLRYREEILKDQQFLAQSLKTILEGEDTEMPPSPKRRRKTSSRSPPPTVALGSLLDLLCSPATPSKVKAGLLACLSRLDTVESFLPLATLLKSLIPFGSTGSNPQPPVSLGWAEGEMVTHLLCRYTTTVAGCIEERSDSLAALVQCLNCSQPLSGREGTVQLAALEQLTSAFMAALPYKARKEVVHTLLGLSCQPGATDMKRRCRKVIKHMLLESSIIVEEFKLVSKTGADSVREAKLQKVKKQATKEDSTLDSPLWLRMTSFLEMIQNKKKIDKPALLVPEAFAVLARLLEVEEKGSGEYQKQLILGTISSICGRHLARAKEQKDDDDEETITGEVLNMELMVQCIRGSDNAHTHHQALILLSQAAKIAPDLLLHNMMSVFTFMGANILRQDDAYSFHVIGRILENVIPALRMACEERAKPSVGTRRRATAPVRPRLEPEVIMTVVLRVFVDAIPHIPAHRKMAVFGKLLSVVGVEDHLWRLVLLLMERITSRGVTEGENEEETEGEKSSGPVNVSDMEFLFSLCEEFSSLQLLKCFRQALKYVIKLPEEKTGGVLVPKPIKDLSLMDLSDNDCEIFSVPHHSAKQLRHFKYGTVYILKELVTSQHFVAEMSVMEPTEFQNPFQQLMETSLQLIGQFTKSHDQADNLSPSKAKFWRILLNKSHDLLDGLIQLLPDSVFLQVCTGLMAHPLALVQRRILELLNTKLHTYKEQRLSKEQMDELSPLVSHLCNIVQQCLLKGKKVESSEEELVIGQHALFGLKVLCRCLGTKQSFLEVLELCTRVLSRQHANGMVCASAMLCGAEVVSTSGVHTLENLTRFMPLVMQQLQADTIMQHDVLLLAGITALQKILEAVPQFLSPYLQDLIVQLCVINAGMHKTAISQKVTAICTTVATVTPTRGFLPTLEKSLIALEDRLPDCAACALSMLQEHIVHMPREDLSHFTHDLLKFFFVCLDLRVTQPQLCGAELEAVESCVVEAFVALVFKLSEAQFKPMLIQLYTWATDEEQSKERVLVFYKLCDRLSAKLKSLFTLFAGHILKHCTQVLDGNNKSKGKCRFFGSGKEARRKSCAVLLSVLGCVKNTLAYDTDGFLDKERFDLLMQPLVDQLENTVGKPSVCEDRVTNHVVPCLANLATAAQDDALWKDLNYQILLKTRHEDSQVRVRALSAIDALHKQLGEDYTQLVPETIPFLAELMEDDSDDVEKKTHKVLAAMEVSVGENLQEYF